MWVYANAMFAKARALQLLPAVTFIHFHQRLFRHACLRAVPPAGPRVAQHRQATCTKLASWSTRCLAALELTFFFFFFGKLVLDLGTVKRNCRHIKKRLFVFCLFLDRASDVFIWRLGSHSLSHYLQLILCFLWATFKSMSNEKYCLILKYVVL